MKKRIRSISFVLVICMCAFLACFGNQITAAADVLGNFTLGNITGDSNVTVVPVENDTSVTDSNDTSVTDSNATVVPDSNATFQGNDTSDFGNNSTMNTTINPEQQEAAENRSTPEPEPAPAPVPQNATDDNNTVEAVVPVNPQLVVRSNAPVNIADLTVTLKKTKYTYNGKAKKPAVTVKNGDTVLKKGTDYIVSYKNNKNAGKAAVTIKGKGGYAGSVKKTFTIAKAKNTIKVTGLKKTLKAGTLKKGKKTFKLKAAAKGKAKCSFKLKSKSANVGKKITVSKTGKVTVKKGTKKGTYTIRVTVTAKAVKNYKKTAVVKKVKITVK